MANVIGSLGTIETLTVGGRVFTNLAGLISLYAKVSTGAQQTTFRKANGTSGYTPSSSFAFQAYALQSYINTASSGALTTGFAQTDNDVGWDTNTALTNPIYFAGANSNVITAQGSLNAPMQMPFDFKIANAKYLTIVIGNVTCLLFLSVFGYEV